jgi:Domain of unknown function (DUF6398)
MRPTAEQVIKLTDKVCADLLDEEYAGLARQVVAKLARKRPSPLQSGRAATWAGGVLWALGQVSFLSDRSTEPYVAHDDLAAAFGLSKSTLGQKAKQIRDTLKMTWATPEFLRAERIDDNPMIWFIEVNGLPTMGCGGLMRGTGHSHWDSGGRGPRRRGVGAPGRQGGALRRPRRRARRGLARE